jgi:hypothetical protein
MPDESYEALREECSPALLHEAERRALLSGRPLSQELAELRFPEPQPPEGGLFG